MNKLFNKLFLTKQYFTIGIRKKGSNNPYNFLSASFDKWFADPMIAEYNSETYLFYESVSKDHGQIEVMKINDDCSIGKPVVILSGNSHYSYPFVFQYNNKWYMIPETSDVGKVCLYKANSFPYEWELIDVLLNEKAVDTTVFKFKNKFFLLTYLINLENEIVIPKAYELDLKSKSIVRELKWNNPNKLEVRGAGPVFSSNNVLYRPAQINKITSYGEGVMIYKIDNCSETYEEKEIYRYSTPKQKFKGKVITGMHTYTVSDNYEAIDVRLRDIDLFKMPKRIINIDNHHE